MAPSLPAATYPGQILVSSLSETRQTIAAGPGTYADHRAARGGAVSSSAASSVVIRASICGKPSTASNASPRRNTTSLTSPPPPSSSQSFSSPDAASAPGFIETVSVDFVPSSGPTATRSAASSISGSGGGGGGRGEGGGGGGMPRWSATPSLPFVGAIVLARVTRLQLHQVNVAILVISKNVVPPHGSFQGVIRREDVRGWEIDRVKMEESFRVGDIVRAVVISLGDQTSYYLSTARNELGVLLATSESRNKMYPISWCEFHDPVTRRTETRKVAKPI